MVIIPIIIIIVFYLKIAAIIRTLNALGEH